MIRRQIPNPKSEIRNWVLAARPKTLPAAMAPVLVGTALAHADESFSPFPALAALVGALLIQIGTNLANDYFDYVKGVDTADRKGPTRVAQSGLIGLNHLRIGMVLTFAMATAVGAYLVAVGGWPILAIGVASIASAIAYTGGPYPLGSHGLGDLLVFLFFGLIAVSGTYYVQALNLRPLVLLAAMPVGTLTTAILVVNNLRDIETDRRAGKHTLAVMIGQRATRLEYVFLLAVAYATPILLWLAGPLSVWVLLPWVSLPLALRLVRTILRQPFDGAQACTERSRSDKAQDTVYRATDGLTPSLRSGQALNEALAGTAKLDLAFSLLFAVGLML